MKALKLNFNCECCNLIKQTSCFASLLFLTGGLALLSTVKSSSTFSDAFSELPKLLRNLVPVTPTKFACFYMLAWISTLCLVATVAGFQKSTQRRYHEILNRGNKLFSTTWSSLLFLNVLRDLRSSLEEQDDFR